MNPSRTRYEPVVGKRGGEAIGYGLLAIGDGGEVRGERLEERGEKAIGYWLWAMGER